MTNWIIGCIVAGVVVVGGGYYIMHHGSGPMSEQHMMNEAGDAMEGTEGSAKFSGSWNDLVQRGGNYVCEVAHTSGVDISSGKVYVSGMNVRGEFVSQTAGGVVSSNMLKKGDTVYVWGGGMPQGVMMKATMMEEGDGGTGMSGEAVDTNQSYDWNCSATGADASQFELPRGIDFMDVSAMMQGMGAIPGAR